MAKSNKPIVWGPFAAGGTLTAFLTPILVLLTLLQPSGLSYESHALASHWAGKVLRGGDLLSLWSAAHRMRITAYDLGLRADAFVAALKHLAAPAPAPRSTTCCEYREDYAAADRNARAAPGGAFQWRLDGGAEPRVRRRSAVLRPGQRRREPRPVGLPVAQLHGHDGARRASACSTSRRNQRRRHRAPQARAAAGSARDGPQRRDAGSGARRPQRSDSRSTA